MIDKQLDKIEVLLLKISDDDEYKRALYDEYSTYRNALEMIPRDVCIPSFLEESVDLLKERLNKYIVDGKSSNPLNDLVPTIKVDEEVKKENFFELVGSNVSYIASRKKKLEVLIAYLNEIDFERASSEDIEAAISNAEHEYSMSNIYFNLIEQEITKAEYWYVIKLIGNHEDEKAQEYIKEFSSDMVLFIHGYHQDTVDNLIRKGQSKLALELSTFLNDFPVGRINEIEFWQILCEIENSKKQFKEESVIDGNNVLNLNSDENEIISDTIFNNTSPKRNQFFNQASQSFKEFVWTISPIQIYNRSKRKTNPKEIFLDFAVLTVYSSAVSMKFKLNYFDVYKEYLVCLKEILKKLRKNNKKAFLRIEVDISDDLLIPNEPEQKRASLKELIKLIERYGHITKLSLSGFNGETYTIHEGEFENCNFEKITIISGSWIIEREAFSSCNSLKKADFKHCEVPSIDECAFKGCKSLETIIFKHAEFGRS